MKSIILAIFIVISNIGNSQVVDSPYDEDSIKIYFLKFLNVERKDHNLNEVEYHDTLNLLSYLHSYELAEKNQLYHSKLTIAHAENCQIFCSYPSVKNNKDIAKILFDVWKNSPGHYKNMLRKDMQFIGLGICYRIPPDNLIKGSFEGYSTLMLY